MYSLTIQNCYVLLCLLKKEICPSVRGEDKSQTFIWLCRNTLKAVSSVSKPRPWGQGVLSCLHMHVVRTALSDGPELLEHGEEKARRALPPHCGCCFVIIVNTLPAKHLFYMKGLFSEGGSSKIFFFLSIRAHYLKFQNTKLFKIFPSLKLENSVILIYSNRHLCFILS